MIPKKNFQFITHIKISIILSIFLVSATKAQSVLAEEYLKKGISFQMKYSSVSGSELHVNNLDSSCYYYQKAREVYKTASDWEHFLSVSLRLAHCHSLLDNTIAISILNETITTCEDSQIESPLLEGAYDMLAKLYKAENLYNEAFYELNKLLDLQSGKYGTEDNRVAVTYYQIGLYYFESGIYKKASVAFLQALSIRKKSGRLAEQPILYKNLAQCSKESGDYEMCAAYLDTAISIADKIYKNPNNDLYNQFGFLYCETGDYQKAKQAFIKSAALQKITEKYDSYKLIPVCRCMAEILLAEGDYTNAEMYLDKGDDIIAASPAGNFTYIKDYYLTRIELLILSEKYNDALKYIQQYKNLMENHPADDATFLDLYSMLGAVYFHQKQYDNSLSYLKKVLLFYAENTGYANPKLNKIYKLMGEIYSVMGNYNSAEAFLKKNLENNIELYGNKSTSTAESYLSLSKMYVSEKNYNNAILNITRAFNALDFDIKDLSNISDSKIRTTIDKIVLFDALTDYDLILEELYSKTKDESYIKDLQKAYSVTAVTLECLKQELHTEESRFFWTEKTHDFFEKAIVTLLRLYYSSSDSSLAETAFYLTEKSKSTLIFNSINFRQAKRNTEGKDSLINTENKIAEELNTLRRLIHNEKEKILPDSIRLNIWNRRLINSNLLYLEVNKELRQKYPDSLSEKRKLWNLTISNVQKNIKQNEVMLNYFMGIKSVIIFSLSNEKFNVTDIQDSSILQKIDSYYNLLQKQASLTKKNNKEVFLSLSYELYSSLLYPALKHYSNKTKLIIIPSGRMGLLPFESLICERKKSTRLDEQDFIIKEYEVVYNYSASLYLNHNPERSYSYDFMGFAPVFKSTDVKDNNVAELPYSIREVETINDLLVGNGQKSKIYIHDKATEEQFKECMRDSSSIIHIASHSYSDLRDPDQSGIYFFRTDTSGQDGILFADEINNMSIKTNLLVMSSCEGGVGKYIKGEGILSLTRGFINSGVPNLIFSLWDVRDKVTCSFMSDFYSGYLEYNDYSKALRLAKLKLLSNEYTASPDGWSSFIMIQNSANIN